MRTHGIGGFNAAADELALSHFDLFEKPEYETGIKDFEDIIVRPITSSNLTGPWSFHIPKDPIKYSAPETLRLKGKLRVRKKQGGTLINLPDNELYHGKPLHCVSKRFLEKVRMKFHGFKIF